MTAGGHTIKIYVCILTFDLLEITINVISTDVYQLSNYQVVLLLVSFTEFSFNRRKDDNEQYHTLYLKCTSYKLKLQE